MTDITISGVDKVLLRNYSFVLHNYLVATRIAQLVFRDGVGWGGVGCDNVGSSCALT